ncbi:MAG: radical SAM protein [Nitrospirae bacterium]|nr:radical SAM protein [Nitrospirota bacterium]
MRLSAPIEVYWWLTSRCNLSCAFCLADGGAPDPGGELDEAGRLAVLRGLTEARVLRVVLSGGEPMLLPGIYGYISELSRAGVSVELTTNGTLIDREAAARLWDSGLRKVQLSLNGSTAAVNDPLMGESYGRITDALDMLVRLGFIVSVKATATRRNMDDVPALARMLMSRGVVKVKVADPTPMGRAFTMRDTLTPGLDEIRSLRETLQGLAASGTVEFGSFMLSMSESGAAARCTASGAAAYRAIITPDGAMAPCTMATLWPKKLNVAELGLTGAWERFAEYSGYLDPDRLGGACGTCLEKNDCGGGCRPLAYLFTGDLNGGYSLCPMGG